MTPSKQMRLGWFVTLASAGLGILLQAVAEALWIYRPRPWKGESTTEIMILWPTVVLLLLPLIAGVVLIFHGYYRHVQSDGPSDPSPPR